MGRLGSRLEARWWSGVGWLAVWAGFAGAGAGCAPEDLPRPDPETHRTEVVTWRTDRLEELTRPDGWLSLAGLFWLEEGESSFGSDAATRGSSKVTCPLLGSSAVTVRSTPSPS